jgi:NADPH:quinone reductase-like Zn-dependent oxidoreductase
MKNIYGLILRGPGKMEFSKNLEELFNFTPEKGQLLVQVKFAPMNPSDFYFYKNVYYDKKPFPCIPGFEGFGIVADVGDDNQKHLIGKPCVFLAFGPGSGAYASHTLTALRNTVILDTLPNPDHFEFLVNPVTAIGLLEEAQKINAKSFIQTGASTSVGKLILYFNSKGSKMDSINIVRDIKHRQELLALGASAVLDSSDKEFNPVLEKLISGHQPTAVFDAVAGKFGASLFNKLPRNAIQWVYGALELRTMDGIDPAEFIFTGKQMRGFHIIHNFLRYKDLGQFHKEINDVANNFKQAPGTKVFDIEHFEEALKYFPHKKEKLLFRCSV